MTSDDQLKAFSQPVSALPAGFTPPPGAPVPTAEDFAAANTSHHAGIMASNPTAPADAPEPPPADGMPWMTIALAIGGVALVGGVAFAVYRSTKSTTNVLQPFAVDPSAVE